MAVALTRTFTQNEVNRQTIKCYRKNDYTIACTCTTDGSTARDIGTPTEVKFTVVDKSTGLRVLQVTKTGGGIAVTGDGSSGVFTITLTDTNLTLDPALHYYDVEITLAGGTIETLAIGDFQIEDIHSDASTS